MTGATPTPYNSKTSLVLQERNLDGIDVLLFNSNVPDSEEGITAAMRDPENIIAGYFVKAADIDMLLEVLNNFKRKHKTYKAFRDNYLGCVDDLGHLDKVIATELDFEESIRVGDVKHYTLTFDAKLFVEGAKDSTTAMAKVLEDWGTEQGLPKMWDIHFTDGGSVWTNNRKTAEKFKTWRAIRYIIPALQKLNLL